MRFQLIAPLLALVTAQAAPLRAQTAAPRSPLDALVVEGLAANPLLRARSFAVDREDAAVAEARGRFLPSLTANARASALAGAPNLGALINPAYAALNQLLGQNAFPTNISLTIVSGQYVCRENYAASPMIEIEVSNRFRSDPSNSTHTPAILSHTHTSHVWLISQFECAQCALQITPTTTVSEYLRRLFSSLS